MEIIYCECNWSIPGVDSLPPHLHIPRKVRIRQGDREWVAPASIYNDNRGPTPGVEILEYLEEGVQFYIHWKEVARP